MVTTSRVCVCVCYVTAVVGSLICLASCGYHCGPCKRNVKNNGDESALALSPPYNFTRVKNHISLSTESSLYMLKRMLVQAIPLKAHAPLVCKASTENGRSLELTRRCGQKKSAHPEVNFQLAPFKVLLFQRIFLNVFVKLSCCRKHASLQGDVRPV